MTKNKCENMSLSDTVGSSPFQESVVCWYLDSKKKCRQAVELIKNPAWSTERQKIFNLVYPQQRHKNLDKRFRVVDKLIIGFLRSSKLPSDISYYVIFYFGCF